MQIAGQAIVNVLALLALVLSAISIYLQLRVRGPVIELLNAKDIQRRVPRPHKDLPKDIQEKYPHIPDVENGYALVKLIFGNSGDRIGIVNIQEIKAKIIQSGQAGIIKPWCDKYMLVPAYEIIEKEILLRNTGINNPTTIEVEIELTVGYGGYNPDSTKYVHQKTIQENIRVDLVSGDETDWLIS